MIQGMKRDSHTTVPPVSILRIVQRSSAVATSVFGVCNGLMLWSSVSIAGNIWLDSIHKGQDSMDVSCVKMRHENTSTEIRVNRIQ